MYDKRTSSLWSTLHGKPVIGPLVDKGIQLKRRSVVTTTWGDWSRRHPDSTVLSLNTGFQRNYDEGAAYRDYFATDRKMFLTPLDDERLPNKREVLALRADDGSNPVAIDTAFLRGHPVYQLTVGQDRVVVLTTPSGESRVFEAGGTRFESWDGSATARDTQGRDWQMDESELRHQDSQQKLPRYPSHQSFWFGWHAQFPDTQLIQ